MSGNRTTEIFKRLYKSSSDVDTMPLLDDCSEDLYQSKKSECESPPAYVGFESSAYCKTGYCKKELYSSVEVDDFAAASDSISAPPEEGLPGCSQIVVDRQPVGRNSSTHSERGNESSCRSVSSRSSTSSGFGSGNERDSMIEVADTATGPSSSEGSSHTHSINDVIASSSLSQNQGISHFEPSRTAGGKNLTVTPSSSAATSGLSECRESSSITRIKETAALSTEQSENSHSERSQSTSYTPHTTQTASNDPFSFSYLSLPSGFDIDRYDYKSSINSRGDSMSLRNCETGITAGEQSGQVRLNMRAQSRDDIIRDDDMEIRSRNILIIRESENDSPESLPLLHIPENHHDPAGRTYRYCGLCGSYTTITDIPEVVLPTSRTAVF